MKQLEKNSRKSEIIAYMASYYEAATVRAVYTVIVNDYEITTFKIIDEEGKDNFKYFAAKIVDGVADYENLIAEGSLDFPMNAVDIYHALTSKRRFLLEGEVLKSYTIFGSIKGIEENEREKVASDHNVPTDAITTDIFRFDVYKHEVVSKR